jgi:hypothetical protein
MTSCSLVGADEDAPEYRADIIAVEAPAQVEAGISFEMVVEGTSGCGELKRIDQERDGNVIRLTAWAHETDETEGSCPVAPIWFRETRTLSLEPTGSYRIVADTVETSIEVR